MVKKMRVSSFAKFSLFMVLLCVVCGLIGEVGGDSLGDQCADNFQKVTTCLTFATGKSDTPTKDCCNAVTDIKASKPVCLCYVIQQMHNGSNSQLKNLGIKQDRLLKLPSTCKLANASISDCPKLLNIPPSSPDYAIFTNNTVSATPIPTTGTSSPATADGSNGFKYGPQFAGSTAIAIAIFFYTFPAGFVSAFHK
ncbi:unnamed protein product [Ilex paraguariensis]|uniref:Bifunctional inhibitor/plant lipid transfer protein/seed storage helical domain-containing protein n=1 Tax=Ilex paraguariensis TaxID=185542 RepID=A0ABC8R3W3_9AQUA